MGTIYSAFGVKALGVSELDLQEAADRRLSAERKVLGWSYTDVLQYQFVKADGPLTNYLGRGFLYDPDLGWLAHAKKYAPQEDIWSELCTIVPFLGEQACLLQSDGCVMVVRNGEKTWVSEAETSEQEQNGWVDFAAENLAVGPLTRISQDEIQKTLLERNQ